MRLIDAERLDVFAAKCPDGRDVYSFMDGVTAVLEEVDKLPVIDLVRCGECATRDKWGCPWWKDEARPDEWFCADGKRREEDAID